MSGILSGIIQDDKNPLDHKDEFFNAWALSTYPDSEKSGVVGIVSLWKKGQYSLVELAWWCQKNSEVRKSILLLYYSQTKNEASGFPDFPSYAKRFSKEEAALRKEEIDEVKKLVELYQPILLKAFEKKQDQ